MTSSILFVCLGNICRSPLVAAVARERFSRAGVSVTVESCGTGNWHVGQGADARSIQVAEEAGYTLSDHRVRQLHARDFGRFDAILGMDDDNIAVLRERLPTGQDDRISLFLDAAGSADAPWPGSPIVPDPYYEDQDAFRHVLALAEQGVDGLIGRLRRGESLVDAARRVAR
jgi:protein-tyrosine phosphatase